LLAEKIVSKYKIFFTLKYVLYSKCKVITTIYLKDGLLTNHQLTPIQREKQNKIKIYINKNKDNEDLTKYSTRDLNNNKRRPNRLV
jgi:hypothetical protein